MYNDPKTMVSKNITHPEKQHVSVVIITLQGQVLISQSTPAAIFLSHILSQAPTLNNNLQNIRLF